MAFPIGRTAVTAVRPRDAVFVAQSALLPASFTWANFTTVWNSYPLLERVTSSLVIFLMFQRYLVQGTAGSVVVVKNLLTDILSLPELRQCRIALHDIDAERLETAGMMARWTPKQFGAEPVIEEHADRRACVGGADFVINTVQIGMHEATLLDFKIPTKYGPKQTIADTVGIGGIFRGLRTIPFMLDLVRDMRAVCPDAPLMNNTNPMSILTWAVYKAVPEQRVVGLCHNIQNTARELSEYLGVEPSRLSYDCAGINHMA